MPCSIGRLVLDFYLMLKQRDNSLLDPWLARVNMSALPELKGVAASMESDFAAARKAISSR
jgi:hypothetical protein